MYDLWFPFLYSYCPISWGRLALWRRYALRMLVHSNFADHTFRILRNFPRYLKDSCVLNQPSLPRVWVKINEQLQAIQEESCPFDLNSASIGILEICIQWRHDRLPMDSDCSRCPLSKGTCSHSLETASILFISSVNQIQYLKYHNG